MTFEVVLMGINGYFCVLSRSWPWNFHWMGFKAPHIVFSYSFTLNTCLLRPMPSQNVKECHYGQIHG